MGLLLCPVRLLTRQCQRPLDPVRERRRCSRFECFPLRPTVTDCPHCSTVALFLSLYEENVQRLCDRESPFHSCLSLSASACCAAGVDVHPGASERHSSSATGSTARTDSAGACFCASAGFIAATAAPTDDSGHASAVRAFGTGISPRSKWAA